MLFVFRFVAVIVLNSLQMSVVIGAFPLKKFRFLILVLFSGHCHLNQSFEIIYLNFYQF